jgi:hypothetical protein
MSYSKSALRNAKKTEADPIKKLSHVAVDNRYDFLRFSYESESISNVGCGINYNKKATRG